MESEGAASSFKISERGRGSLLESISYQRQTPEWRKMAEEIWLQGVNKTGREYDDVQTGMSKEVFIERGPDKRIKM